MPEFYMLEIDLIDSPERYVHHTDDDKAAISSTSSHKFSLQELVDDFVEKNERFFEKKIQIGWDIPDELEFEHRMHKNQMAVEKRPVDWHYKSLIQEKRLEIQTLFLEIGYSINIE